MKIKNKTLKSIEEVYIGLFIIFFILTLSSIGIIAYISNRVNMPIIRLWKEIYILGMFFMSIIIIIKNKKKSLGTLIAIVLGVYSIWIIYSFFNSNIRQVLYQIKLDGFNILFFINVTVLLSLRKKDIVDRIIKIILVFAIINAIIIILQGLFPRFFVCNILGLEWGAWSRDYGITVVVAGDTLRSFGLMNTYVAASELLIIATILLFEGKNILRLSTKAKCLLASVFFIGIYFTTYKTAYAWLIIYGFVKILRLFIQKYKKKLPIRSRKIDVSEYPLLIIGIGAMLIQYVVTNTLLIYKLIEKIFPKFAYGSIYARVDLHNVIFNQLDNITKKIFGVGMGVNGLFALKDVGEVHTQAIALDSTYIYTLSNYGFLGVIIYLVLLGGTLIISVTNKECDLWGVRYICAYLLCAEFFFNNLSTSIPVSYIVIFLILVFCFELKEKKLRSNRS